MNNKQELIDRLQVVKAHFGGAVIILKSDFYSSKEEAQAYIDSLRKEFEAVPPAPVPTLKQRD